MQIYILNRARETLATTASIYNDKHTLTLEAGSSSYEFTIDKSDEASHYLDSGNYIVLQDDKCKTRLFTILDYEETHNTKTVYAEDAGIELINKAVDIWKGDGPHPFSYYFDLVTKGTPWKLGVNQLAGLERTLTYEGRDTGLGRLLSILKGFDNAECTFDVTVKMNAPADFKINVYKQVGNDRSDVQIVYNNELNDITKKESRAEFVTALAGVGGQIQTEDGSEGGNVDFSELEYDKDGFVTKKGDKFLRAVDANRTFNPGQESYIESFYEYDTQSPSELLNRTLSKLKTYSEPQYTYTADVKVIDPSLVLGDTVTILDHDYNPAIYLSARVAKLVKSYTDPAQNEIEFTNYRLLSSALADKLARLQVIVNALPSASRVSAIETNLTKLTKQQEEVIVKVESANGKNTNYYGGSQPESAKQGDSWFYTDEEGNQGIKQYQDGVWVDVISSKFGPKLEADIKQAQADAKVLSSEVESAKKQAQEAFAKAGFNADEISNVKTATSEVTETLTSTVQQANELSESLKNVVSETASQYSTVSSELSGARESLTVKASELAKEVASNSANITKANSQLYSQSEGLAKVSQSATKMEQTMTDLSGRVHTVETTASETKEALADAKGNITTLTKRADGTDTKIADAQGRVQTLESRAGKWDLELSKKVDNTTYNAGIQNLGNQINLKANKSDLDGYATKAQLSVESDRITQQASEISSVTTIANGANRKIDNLSFGGRNLLKGTSDQFKTISNSGWMWAHTWTNNDNNTSKISLANFPSGDYLTYSAWVINDSDVDVTPEIMFFDKNLGNYTGTRGNVLRPGQSGLVTNTRQIGSNDWYVRPSITSTNGQAGTHQIRIKEEMLTLGNVRLPWQPSDLDLPDTIVTTVTEVSNAQQIINSSGIHTDINKVRTETTGKINAVDSRVSDVNNKVDNLKVGGTNLLNGSSTLKIVGSADSNAKDGTWRLANFGNSTPLQNVTNELPPVVGVTNAIKISPLTGVAQDRASLSKGTYTFSVWLKGTKGAKYYIYPFWNNTANYASSGEKTLTTSDWDRVSFTVDLKTDENVISTAYVYNHDKTNVLYMAAPQLEKASRPSDYSLSQNDLQRLAHDDAASQINASITPISTTVNQYTHTTDNLANKVTDIFKDIGYDQANHKFTDKFKSVVETAGGTKETYRMLEGKIDGIVVGGKNLLDGTSDFNSNYWYASNGTADIMQINGKTAVRGLKNWEGRRYKGTIQLEPDTDYTVSVYVRVNGKDGSGLNLGFYCNLDGNGDSWGLFNLGTLSTEWKRVSLKWHNNNHREMTIPRVEWSGDFTTGLGSGFTAELQLEKGNKPSDWGMSDNDINKKISDANVSIAKTNETIKTVDGNVTTVKNNLDKTKSVVTQLANLFDVKVGDSSISVTNGGVLVKGKQIHIDGQTVIDNASIDGAKIKSLDAGKITTGTLNAAAVKVINIDASKITTGKLNGMAVKIDGKTSEIDMTTDRGVIFRQKNGTWATTLTSYQIQFENNSSGQSEILGSLTAQYNTESKNINGIGIVIPTQQKLGAPYGGDEFSIGYATDRNGHSTSDFIYNASGQVRSKGFHWYESSHLYGKAQVLYIDGAHDPLWIRGVKFDKSSQNGYYQPTISAGWGGNTYGNSGISFLWDSILLYGSVQLGNIRVADATNAIGVGWTSWSDWNNEKYPSFTNENGSNHGGIAFPPNGNTVVWSGMTGQRQNTWK